MSAGTIEESAQTLEASTPEAFVKTVRQLNAAVRQDVPFDPNVLDGRRTEGLTIDKSNWATLVDEPPFEAYAVTCGITFTFGGLRITEEAQVIDSDGLPIPGLYACGELVGGLFYNNYPGGTGLMNGAVFGRHRGCLGSRVGAGEEAKTARPYRITVGVASTAGQTRPRKGGGWR